MGSPTMDNAAQKRIAVDLSEEAGLLLVEIL
jgi:hypothetical protein